MTSDSNKTRAKRQLQDPLLIDTALADMPRPVFDELLALRELIFDTHALEPKAGQLSEVLRWGQLSYITQKPKTGSMLRLGMSKCGRPTLFCHCGTTLIDSFRQQFTEHFDFEGNRALILKRPVETSQQALQQCIHQALVYHLH